MKKISIAIILLLLIAGGGYCALWYTQAEVAKGQVEKILAKANQEHEFITYESVTTTGFPLAVGVSVNKPVVDLPMNTLIEPFTHTLPVSPDGTQMADMRQKLLSLPQWQEKISLDGSVIISINALSNTYAIHTTGHYSGVSQLGEKSWEYAMTPGGEKRGCDVDFSQSIVSKSFMDLWNWELLKEDPKLILQNITRVECDIASFVSTGGPSGDELLNSKPARIFFDNDSKGDQFDIVFDIDIPSVIATDAYDSLVATYYGLIYDQPMPVHYKASLYGDQSIRMKGKVKLDGKEPHKHPMQVEVEEFSMHSDISTADYALKFAFNPTGDLTGDGTIYNKLSISANEQGYKLYLSQAEEAARDIYAQMLIATGAQTIENLSEEQLTEVLKNLVPKTHELGEMVFEVDVSGNSGDGGKVGVDIKNIELGATPYGLKANGKLQIASIILPIPTGNVDVNCRNCEPFVTDVMNWLGRLRPVMMVDTNSEDYELFANFDEQRTADALKRFLKTLDPKGGTDLNFAVKLSPQGALTVNDMDSGQLMILVQELAQVLHPPVVEEGAEEGTVEGAAEETTEESKAETKEIPAAEEGAEAAEGVTPPMSMQEPKKDIDKPKPNAAKVAPARKVQQKARVNDAYRPPKAALTATAPKVPDPDNAPVASNESSFVDDLWDLIPAAGTPKPAPSKPDSAQAKPVPQTNIQQQ